MYKAIIRLSVSAFLLYALWLFFFKGLNYISPSYATGLENFEDFVRFAIMKPSQWIVNLFTGLGITMKDDLFYYHQDPVLKINDECLALKLMYVTAIPVIILPGSGWKNKLWYVPSGILLVHLMNIVRITGLLFTVMYTDYFDFMHSFVFRIMIYLSIIAFWLIWMKYFVDNSRLRSWIGGNEPDPHDSETVPGK